MDFFDASRRDAAAPGDASPNGPDSAADGGADAPYVPPGPSPGCVVPDVDGGTISISFPSPLTTYDTPTVRVVDTAVGRTNVGLRLCTPSGAVVPVFGGVDSTVQPFAWHWNAPSLPLGITQAIFTADPAAGVLETVRVEVGPPVGDAGTPPIPCSSPPGNVIADGTFSGGMSGLAPVNWQVREPGAPSNPCPASGTPSQHVFMGAGPPSCGGNAVTIDARGQWDCYAIQRYSDYGTIVGGATYRISAVARSTGNAPSGGGTICPECVSAWFHVGAQWLDENDLVFGDEKNPKPIAAADNDYDWKVLSWDLVAPANAHRIVVWLTAHYPGRVEYTNVSVVKQ